MPSDSYSSQCLRLTPMSAKANRASLATPIVKGASRKTKGPGSTFSSRQTSSTNISAYLSSDRNSFSPHLLWFIASSRRALPSRVLTPRLSQAVSNVLLLRCCVPTRIPRQLDSGIPIPGNVENQVHFQSTQCLAEPRGSRMQDKLASMLKHALLTLHQPAKPAGVDHLQLAQVQQNFAAIQSVAQNTFQCVAVTKYIIQTKGARNRYASNLSVI